MEGTTQLVYISQRTSMACFPHGLELSSARLPWVWEHKRNEVGNEVEEDADGYLYEGDVKEKRRFERHDARPAVMQRATSSASST